MLLKEKFCKVIFFIWFGVIVFVSVVPYGTNDQSWLSKMTLIPSGFILHVFGYFVLSAFAYLAFGKKRLWLYLLVIILMGALLEGVQYALSYRTFNVYDIVGNGIGVFVFVVWVLFFCHPCEIVPIGREFHGAGSDGHRFSLDRLGREKFSIRRVLKNGY